MDVFCHPSDQSYYQLSSTIMSILAEPDESCGNEKHRNQNYVCPAQGLIDPIDPLPLAEGCGSSAVSAQAAAWQNFVLVSTIPQMFVHSVADLEITSMSLGHKIYYTFHQQSGMNVCRVRTQSTKMQEICRPHPI